MNKHFQVIKFAPNSFQTTLNKVCQFKEIPTKTKDGVVAFLVIKISVSQFLESNSAADIQNSKRGELISNHFSALI